MSVSIHKDYVRVDTEIPVEDTLLETSDTVNKTYQQAEKIYPGILAISQNRKAMHARDVENLSVKLKDLKYLMSWFPCPLTNIGLTGIGLLMVAGGVASLLCNLPGMGIPLTVFGAPLMPAPWTYFLDWQKKNEFRVKEYAREGEVSQCQVEVLEAMLDLAEDTGKFLEMYQQFKKNPQEANIKPLFVLLTQLNEDRSSCSKIILKLIGKEKDGTKHSPLMNTLSGDSLVFGNMSYIYLMDSVCSELKEGSLKKAWNEVLAKPIQEISQITRETSVWSLVGKDFSGKVEDYVRYLNSPSKSKGEAFSEALQRNFLLIMNQFIAVSGS